MNNFCCARCKFMVIQVLERVGELDIIILGWSHLWRFPKRLRHISTVKLFAKNSETSRCYFADDQTTDDKMLVPQAFIKIDQPRFLSTYISTLSTLIPHGSVASSKAACKTRGYTHFSWLELSALGGMNSHFLEKCIWCTYLHFQIDFEQGLNWTECFATSNIPVFHITLLITTLQSVMNVIFSKQRFWHCHEKELIKTIQTIPPQPIGECHKLTSLYWGLG